MPDPSVRVTFEAGSRLSSATEHALLPLVHVLHVHNDGPETLERLAVWLTMEPECGPGWSETVSALPPGEVWTLKRPRLAFSPVALDTVSEARAGVLRASVRVGSVEAVHEAPVTILPASHWPGSEAPLGLLASFVLPNDPAVLAVLHAAAGHLETATGTRALDGYQAGLRQAVVNQVQAIWLAMVELGIAYLSPPPSFERQGQKVMRPAEVTRSRAGACLDLSATLAALFERCGLHAVLVVIEGHAFAGVWLEPSPYRDAIHDTAVSIRKAVDAGELLLLESTTLASGTSIEAARVAARQHLDDPERFLFLLDVQAARTEGFLPLAFAVESSAERDDLDVPRPTGWTDVAVPEREHLLEDTTGGTRGRLDKWKEKLLDLSLRNRLLNFRPSRTTVELVPHDLGALEDRLAGGALVPVVHRPEQRGTPDPERLPILAKVHADRGESLADHTETDLQRRMLELFRTGRSSLQESGAVTTYLALGMLRWQDKKTPEKTRSAPLLLLPVHVRKGTAHRPYSITLAEEADPQLNVTLLTLLRRDYQLEHPGLDPDTLPEDHAGIDVPLLLQRFRELVRKQTTWEVESRAVLAILTFTKFLMYKDLVASTDLLLESDVVRRIFEGTGGTFGLEQPLLHEHELDGTLAPADVLPVLPADPSQLAAVAACAHGSSYVLQGPPGTGKSQTITNLIADTLARGQTVLFVAEKKAAIDVVHRRLSQVGLDPFALELHSDKANKKEALEQVRHALRLVDTAAPRNWEATAEELTRLRARLNAFATAMRASSCLDLPNHEALAQLIGLRDEPVVPLIFSALTPSAVREHEAAVRHAVHILDSVGEVGQSPWKGARRTEAAPPLDTDLPRHLRTLDDAIAQLNHAAADLPSGWWQDGNADQRHALATLAQHTATAGDLPQGLLNAPRLDDTEAELRALANQTEHRRSLWAPLAPTWSPDLLTDAPTRTGLLTHFEKWAEVFFVGWLVLFFSRSKVKRWYEGALPANGVVRDQLRGVEATARADAGLADQDGPARALLGALWQRSDTDWDTVWSIWARVQSLRDALASVPLQCSEQARATLRDHAERLVPGRPLSQQLLAFAQAETDLTAACAGLQELLQLEPATLAALDLPGLSDWSRQAAGSGYSSLRKWCAWQDARAQLAALGLTPLVHALEDSGLPTPQLLPALQRAHRAHAWAEACREHSVLDSFSGVTHNAIIEQFRDTDRRWEAVSRDLVRARVAERMPDPGAPGEMAVIRRQLNLKSRHMSLRRLFQEVPTTLRALKPCVLMSPLSVARYLDPGGAPFDLVLFDEASQIPPWDAIGAIARGHRCIVVGDSRQLPPTSFFARGDTDEDEDIDEDRLEDMESILEEAVSSGMQELRLLWHYRSRHESLITFSNRTYYDSHLLTFPAADHETLQLGVKLVPVPEGHYDRGSTRTNRAEAERIVAWLADWARQPEAERGSVGVVTFNMAQQRLIEDLLDARASTDPHLEARLSDPDDRDPLFVKNLENVQGDERDTILFSICYGPDASGRVAMNFGPLNKRGGERRLNVAVTRARRLLLVFSTLRHDQIQLGRTSAVGVHHLRTFLDFAGRGVIALEDSTALDVRPPTGSPLEKEVREAIVDLGWTVVPHVGCSGYRIDLAVEDPQKPGRFLLGVECDGVSYHSSASARARDRQRQEVLEGLGWRFHRIWSTEWWHDRKGELARLQAALDAAELAQREADEAADRAAIAAPALAAPVPLASVEAPALPVPLEAAPPPSRPTFRMPPSPNGTEDDLRDPTRTHIAAGWLQQLVDDVGPVHEAPAFRWLVQGTVSGDSERVRVGSRLKRACEQAANQLVRQGTVERHGDFLWPRDRRPTWTDWRLAGDRDAEHISPEEVRNAAADVLRGALSISREDLLKVVANHLGFQRLARKVRESMERGVDLLVAEGLAEAVDESVRWLHQK